MIQPIAHVCAARNSRTDADNLAYRIRTAEADPTIFCSRLTLPTGQTVYRIARPVRPRTEGAPSHA